MLDKLLLRVGEAAEILAISRSKAYEMIASGEIPAIRLRGSIRIVMSDLERMIEAESRVVPLDGQAETKFERVVRPGHLTAV